MFNSTHTLVGLTLARAGLDRLAPHAVWTAVIAANMCDIDGITLIKGTASYLDVHRGFSHSILGIPLLSLALAGVMFWATGRFLGHLAVALAVAATHPLLDFANTYGIRPLFPFDSHWIYGDILFVIDPYL